MDQNAAKQPASGEQDDPLLGTVLHERYRILERLAAGGMGVVYRGERIELERPVAIKFLHAGFVHSPQSMQRFKREAQTMSRLAHPNCVSVIDIGFSGVAPYIVMDFVTGRTLEDVLQQDGRFFPGRAIHIVKQILSALTHAHGQDLVHRDIKPANIMLSNAEGTVDHVFVLDFGLAKFSSDTRDNNITGASTLLGTPSYMSPEQTRGEEVGPASDVYSTGIMLFELLTGHKPFAAQNPLETLYMHQGAPIPRLRERFSGIEFSEDLENVIQSALAKQPDQRFASAAAFATALDAVPESAAYTPPRPASRQVGEGRPAGKKQRIQERLAFASTQPVTTLDLELRANSDSAQATAVITTSAQLQKNESMQPQKSESAKRQAASDPAGRVVHGTDATALLQSLDISEPGLPAPERAQPKDHSSARTREDHAQTTDPVAAPARENSDSSPAPTTKTPHRPAPRARTATPVPGSHPVVKPPGRSRRLLVIALVIAAAAIGLGLMIWLMDSSGDTGERRAPGQPGATIGEESDSAAGKSDEPVIIPKQAPVAEIDSDVAGTSPEPMVVRRVEDVEALIDQGRSDEAIDGIYKLLGSTHKDSPYLNYRLGNLYFERGQADKGLDAYRKALIKKRKYRDYASINQNVISALASDKTRRSANGLYLQYIKKAGLRYLKQAASEHENPVVRKRAAWLIGQISGK